LPRCADETLAPAPARIAAARDLLDVVGVTRQMDGMVSAMSQGFSQGAGSANPAVGKKLSGEFDAMMRKLLVYKEQMISDVAVLYAQTFTADEMKTVADFYRTGPGAKFIAKTPELMQKGAAIGMKYSQKIIDDMRKAEPGRLPPVGEPQ
jgi:hypothetical protein